MSIDANEQNQLDVLSPLCIAVVSAWDDLDPADPIRQAFAGEGADLGSDPPEALGSASAGADESASRQDHIHPTTGLAVLGASNVFSSGPQRATLGAAADEAWTAQVLGDTQDRFAVAADGALEWGPGNANPDQFIHRGSNGLRISGTPGDVARGTLDLNDPLLDTVAVLTAIRSDSRGLILKGAVGQTADLLQFHNSAGVVQQAWSPLGRLSTHMMPASTNAADLGAPTLRWKILWGVTADLAVATTTDVGLAVQGAAAQSGDLVQARNSSGAVLASIGAAGLLRWNAAANEQTTVGSAGGASNLPLAPTKYLKVVDSSGATLVIPAYAAS